MALSFPLTTKFFIESDSKDAPYVAYCPELDISSCGKNEDEARKMLKEAIEIVLSEAARDGTLDKYLRSVGYSKSGRQLNLPKISFEPFIFNFPDNLKMPQWLT